MGGAVQNNLEPEVSLMLKKLVAVTVTVLGPHQHQQHFLVHMSGGSGANLFETFPNHSFFHFSNF